MPERRCILATNRFEPWQKDVHNAMDISSFVNDCASDNFKIYPPPQKKINILLFYGLLRCGTVNFGLFPAAALLS